MGIFRRARNTDPLQAAVCGCGHHLALHDRDNHTCGHTTAIYNDVEDVVRKKDGNPVLTEWGNVQRVRNRVYAKTVQCGCRRYVGPEIVNPLSPGPFLVP